MIQENWISVPDPLFWLEGPPPPLERIKGVKMQAGSLTHSGWPFGYKFILTSTGQLIYRVDIIPADSPEGWTKVTHE